MSNISPAITTQISCISEPAEAMLNRVFKAAEILATVKQPKNFPTEAGEKRTKNPVQHELRYRKD